MNFFKGQNGQDGGNLGENFGEGSNENSSEQSRETSSKTIKSEPSLLTNSFIWQDEKSKHLQDESAIYWRYQFSKITDWTNDKFQKFDVSEFAEVLRKAKLEKLTTFEIDNHTLYVLCEFKGNEKEVKIKGKYCLVAYDIKNFRLRAKPEYFIFWYFRIQLYIPESFLTPRKTIPP